LCAVTEKVRKSAGMNRWCGSILLVASSRGIGVGGYERAQ